MIFEQIEALRKQMDTAKVAITLDWLSLYFTQTGIFENEYEEGDSVYINEECFLVEGSPQYGQAGASIADSTSKIIVFSSIVKSIYLN